MTTPPTVCIAIPLEDDLLAQIGETCTVRHVAGRDRGQLLSAVRDVEGILLSAGFLVDAELFDAAPRMRVVSSSSVGYDGFDIAEATRRGVVVCNTPGVLTAAVADLTMALIISLARRLFLFEAYVRRGGWARRETPPPLAADIAGKTLGVIGFGRIGQEVTRRMQALGMRTLWNDVFDAAPDSAPPSEYRPLDDLLPEADFVSLHGDLNPSSHHLIGAAELRRMKPSAFIVNTSRGPLIDQKALTKALQDGTIAGAALDVLEREPPDEDDPIMRLDNVICFPHIGTATEETRRAMRELAVRNLLTAVAGDLPPTPINPEVLG